MRPNLHIHVGNAPETLARVLADALAETAPRDPITPFRIGAAQRGMQRMLETQIALRHGVSANLQQVFPSRLLFQIGHALNNEGRWDDDTKDIVWTPELLRWAVYAELEHVDISGPSRRDGYDPLRRWLQKAQGGADVRSRRVLMQLAAQLARVFDAYNLDRPEWHQDWVATEASAQLELFIERGGPENLPEELAWQKDLWHNVHLRLATQVASPVKLLDNILRADARAAEQLRETLPALHIFGVTHIHRLQRALIQAVAQHIPVHLYVASVTSAWWSDQGVITDLDAGVAPLLTRFGQHARFLHDELVTIDESPSLRTHYEDHYVVPRGDHALGHLQRAILAPSDETLALFPAPDSDRSIAFHASHGAMRQVEILHDAILECFDRDPTLEPSDVVVFSPQLRDFAPLVEAVFNATDPTIPYRIEDRALDAANMVAQALRKLLELSDGRSAAPRLLELLALQPVRVRFGLEEDDISLASAWLEALDVRWGWDDDDRSARGRPGASTATWSHALERLALGVMMGQRDDDAAPQLRGRVAFTALQDRDITLVGKLTRFVREVFAMLQTLDQPHSVEGWVDALVGNPNAADGDEARLGILSRLVHVEGSQSFLLSEIITTISTLREHAEITDLRDRLLDPDAFKSWLVEVLGQDMQMAVTGRGAVSFARLDASRFASARVIFLLGMDDGSFPRPAQLPSWDIRQANRRARDHSDRDEDLYAVLQALTLAQDHFGVIWRALDPNTSQELPPALPVLEMQRLMELHMEDGAEFIRRRTTKHRMQPFALETFLTADGDAPNLPFTYQRQWANAALAGATRRADDSPHTLVSPSYTRPEDDSEATISSRKLAQRLVHPQQALLRDAAQISLEADERALPDEDPASPDILETIGLYRALFQLSIEHYATHGETLRAPLSHALLQRLRALAALRPGRLGEATINRLLTARLTDILDRYLPSIQRPSAAPKSVTFGETTYFSTPTIQLDDAHQTPAFAFHHPPKINAYIEPWVMVCIEAAANDAPATIELLHIYGDPRVETIGVSPAEAREWLRTAHALNTQLMHSPIALNREAMRTLVPKLEHDALVKTVADLELLQDGVQGSDTDAAETRFAANLNRAWRDTRNHRGPTAWTRAVFGNDRHWQAASSADADDFDRALRQQTYAVLQPIVAALIAQGAGETP